MAKQIGPVPPFVHLHTHSTYSLMQGTASPGALLQAVRERGMDAVALTDVNGLYGLVHFLEIARAVEVRPIIGAEIVTDDSRLVLLTKSCEGYANLCRIITARHRDEAFDLTRTLLAHARGLVVLSDDRPLLEATVGLPDRYAELRPAFSPYDLYRWARARGIPCVATAGACFITPARGAGAEDEEYAFHRLLRAIDRNTTLTRVPPEDLEPPSARLFTPAEMIAHFPYAPEAIENTRRIAEACIPTSREAEPRAGGTTAHLGTIIFPAYAGLAREEAFRLLRDKCITGAKHRYGEMAGPIAERLRYELDVIREKGFADYFLVVEEIVRRSPKTCGRGSAAASLVSYCLGITHVDPIRHNLFFERFLNRGRKDPPDIDVDFPWDERDAVLDFVWERYGRGRAAMVSNHVGFRARAAVHEVAKVYGIPEKEITAVTKRLSYYDDAEGLDRRVATHPIFKDTEFPPPWPEILKQAQRLTGQLRHLSTHCGGVVIVPDEIARHVPVQRAAKGVDIIQWEKDQTEDAGLVKIDILGNRSLAVIRDALSAIERNTGCRIDYARWNPIDDPETQDLIRRGDTIGVFYVESPAMRQLQQKAKTGDFEHLVIHSSMIRPAANDYIREYVRRLHGGAYRSIHPLLDEILKETHGIMCYQEDVTRIVMAMAGFSEVDGDGLRKTLSRKHRTRKLADYQRQFFEGARARGVSEEVIRKVWEQILSFAGYSFCKPHSASYALVSYKSAYLRAHYPAEFMAAVLSNGGGYYSTFAYVSEAKRMGLRVLPPDANESEEAYTGAGEEIRIGLMQLKNLNRKSMEALLSERRTRGAYASFENFLERADTDPADVKILLRAGCFDSVSGGRTRPELLWHLYEWTKRRPRKAFSFSLPFPPRARPLPRAAEYDTRTALRHEAEALGFLASRHPLTLYAGVLRGLDYVPAREIPRHAGRRVTTIGWLVTGKVVTTASDEPMEFVSFEDTTALYEAAFFPPAYRRFCHMLTKSRPYVLYGCVEEDFGAVSLSVDRLDLLPPPKHMGLRP